jgi:ubiquinone/menaquinone biosynthesis C-methylase UbiE
MPSIEENRNFWGRDYHWKELGEDWGPKDPRWKATILERAVTPFLFPGARVLEIGPGAGRFTEELLKREPRSIVLLDLAQKCLDMCKERFGADPRLEYVLSNGRSLPGIADQSVDFIFSFDVFVHIEKPELEAYFEEFKRVLKPGGTASIHYATIDRADPTIDPDPRIGWRADYRSTDMHNLLTRLGLEGLDDFYHPLLSCGNSSMVSLRKPAVY